MQRHHRLAMILAVLLVGWGPNQARAATGCTLNDPDRDVRRLFPRATNYRTDFITIDERGGKVLRAELEKQLGDQLDSLYETDVVPYAYYTILQGTNVIGRVHGINQRGTYGGMQLILATDPRGKVRAFYYQKLSSPEARTFRRPAFTDRFTGLTLADFVSTSPQRLPDITDPSRKSKADFEATLRGVHKNLILLHLFHPEIKPVNQSTPTPEVPHENP